MFTDPPLARVGLDEGEARRQGIPVRVAKLPMSNVLRTNATNETEGFMKILVGQHDDQIVGFSMIGAEAGEVMTAVQTAMLAGLPYPKLRDAVIAHLTYSEGLGPLLGDLPGDHVRIIAVQCYRDVWVSALLRTVLVTGESDKWQDEMRSLTLSSRSRRRIVFFEIDVGFGSSKDVASVSATPALDPKADITQRVPSSCSAVDLDVCNWDLAAIHKRRSAEFSDIRLNRRRHARV